MSPPNRNRPPRLQTPKHNPALRIPRNQPRIPPQKPRDMYWRRMTTKNIRRLRCAWSDGHLESLRDGKPKRSDGCGDGEYNPAHLVCLEFWVLLIKIIVDEISSLLMSLH